jgi:hypothetical protein
VNREARRRQFKMHKRTRLTTLEEAKAFLAKQKVSHYMTDEGEQMPVNLADEPQINRILRHFYGLKIEG